MYQSDRDRGNQSVEQIEGDLNQLRSAQVKAMHQDVKAGGKYDDCNDGQDSANAFFAVLMIDRRPRRYSFSEVTSHQN